MIDFGINEMLDMQKRLQDKYIRIVNPLKIDYNDTNNRDFKGEDL